MTTWTQFRPFFDHLPTFTWTYVTLNVDKNRHFWTTYPPLLVHVVIECPLNHVDFNLEPRFLNKTGYYTVVSPSIALVLGNTVVNTMLLILFSIIPILGIGIDDMFVIVQSHINLEQNDPSWKKRPIDELVGETLKHAGVAITITSITDLLVFIVGASTVSVLVLIFPFSLFIDRLIR